MKLPITGTTIYLAGGVSAGELRLHVPAGHRHSRIHQVANVEVGPIPPLQAKAK